MSKGIFRDSTRKVSDGTTPIDVVLKRFPTNRQGVMRYITVENETNNFTRLLIGIRDIDQVHWLADKVGAAAGTKYWISDDVPIEDGEEIIARFTGTTSGDVLTVTARGWMWPAKEMMSDATPP